MKRIKSCFSACLSLSLLFNGAVSFASPAALSRIGVAAAVQGKVLALAPAPQAVGRIMQSGKELYLNDKVTTDEKGRLQIMLLDETVFTIGPNSALTLDEFVYDPATSAGKVTVNVTKGVFRFVTGKVARKEPSNMKVNLPVGTVGIRGTIVAGKIDPSGACSIVLLGPGPANNGGDAIGAFKLENALGSAYVTRPGYGSRIESHNTPPTPPAFVPPSQLIVILGALSPEQAYRQGPPPMSAEQMANMTPEQRVARSAPMPGQMGPYQAMTAEQMANMTPEQRTAHSAYMAGQISPMGPYPMTDQYMMMGYGGGSVADASYQSMYSAYGDLTYVNYTNAMTMHYGDFTQYASQAMPLNIGTPGSVSNGPAFWEDLHTVTSGGGSFAPVSGVFGLTICGGVACTGTITNGTWGYNMSVDFGSRMITGTANISGASASGGGGFTVPSNNVAISQSFAALTGNASFSATSGNYQYNFGLGNYNGVAAQNMNGSSGYSNAGTQGQGAMLNTSR